MLPKYFSAWQAMSERAQSPALHIPSTRFWRIAQVHTAVSCIYPAVHNTPNSTYRLFPFHALDQLLVVQVCILAALLDDLGQLVLEPVKGTGIREYFLGGFSISARTPTPLTSRPAE